MRQPPITIELSEAPLNAAETSGYCGQRVSTGSRLHEKRSQGRNDPSLCNIEEIEMTARSTITIEQLLPLVIGLVPGMADVPPESVAYGFECALDLDRGLHCKPDMIVRVAELIQKLQPTPRSESVPDRDFEEELGGLLSYFPGAITVAGVAVTADGVSMCELHGSAICNNSTGNARYWSRHGGDSVPEREDYIRGVTADVCKDVTCWGADHVFIANADERVNSECYAETVWICGYLGCHIKGARLIHHSVDLRKLATRTRFEGWDNPAFMMAFGAAYEGLRRCGIDPSTPSESNQ